MGHGLKTPGRAILKKMNSVPLGVSKGPVITLDLPDPFLLMQNMRRHAAAFSTLCTLHLPWQNI